MSKIQALQAQARGAVGKAKTSEVIVAGVDTRHRLSLVNALRKTGKFVDVTSVEDRRSNPTKIYLGLRANFLAQPGYLATIKQIAKDAGYVIDLNLTSGSAYEKRFRVTTLRAIEPTKDLFTAMAATQAPKVVKGTVQIEGQTYTGLSADAIRQIKAIADRENTVQIRLINVNNMQSVNLQVPVVVRDAITGKTPRFTFAGRWTVMTTQGLTVLHFDGQKYAYSV